MSTPDLMISHVEFFRPYSDKSRDYTLAPALLCFPLLAPLPYARKRELLAQSVADLALRACPLAWRDHVRCVEVGTNDLAAGNRSAVVRLWLAVPLLACPDTLEPCADYLALPRTAVLPPSPAHATTDEAHGPDGLTPRHSQILAWIRMRHKRHGYGYPSRRAIARAFALSTATVARYLCDLAALRYLTLPGSGRTGYSLAAPDVVR